MPSYKPKSQYRTRRSGAEADAEEAWPDHAATAIDRPLVDLAELQHAQLSERVERDRRDREASARDRRRRWLTVTLVLGLALAAGAALGTFLALSR